MIGYHQTDLIWNKDGVKSNSVCNHTSDKQNQNSLKLWQNLIKRLDMGFY